MGKKRRGMMKILKIQILIDKQIGIRTSLGLSSFRDAKSVLRMRKGKV